MKIKAIWRKNNFNPFFPGHTPPPGSFYSKTVEVPDNTDLKQLKQYAIDDSQEGYEFACFEDSQGNKFKI